MKTMTIETIFTLRGVTVHSTANLLRLKERLFVRGK